ncbi:MAG: TIGR03986 family type III CRISPR-associated RAMP protein, partial [Bacillota bacterium]
APPGERVAWAGRVKFSHAEIKGRWQAEAEIPLAVLSRPKPTTTVFYLLDGQGKPCALVNYDWPNARLRGRKFYRHHGQVDEREYKREDRDGQNRTVRGAIKPGAEFVCTVDFTNLTPLELGALLYALELEEGMVHRLGYAKPLGFGSIKLSVERLEMICWADRLASPDNGAGRQDFGREKIAEFKQRFLEEMARQYGEAWADVLADLKALLGSPPALPVHYPRPRRRFDPRHPQFEWFVGNKKRLERFTRNKAGAADSDQKSPPPVTLPLARQDAEGLPLIDKKGD